MEKTTEELTNEFLKSLDLLNYKKGGAVEYRMNEADNEARMMRGKCRCGQAHNQCLCLFPKDEI